MTRRTRAPTRPAILYKQGLAKAIELVDANDSRFIAEVNYASAEFAMALAYLGAAAGARPRPARNGAPMKTAR